VAQGIFRAPGRNASKYANSTSIKNCGGLVEMAAELKSRLMACLTEALRLWTLDHHREVSS
jgi:hypothetical protein